MQERDQSLEVVRAADAERERQVQERLASLERAAEELSAANLALKQSEELYRQMFERNRAVKLLIDPASGALVAANPAACDFYGYTKEALLSMRITDLNTAPVQQVLSDMQQALEEHKNYFTFRHRLSSGETRDVAVYSSPIELQGRLLLYSIIHDISERRQAEQAVERQAEHLRILHQIDRAVLAAKSREEIAQVAVERVRAVAHWQRVAVWLFGTSACEARLLAVDVEGETAIAAGRCISFVDLGFGPEELQGGPRGIEELGAASGLSLFARSLLREGVRSLTVFPLASGEQVIGCLNLGSATPGRVPAEYADFARQVAVSLAVAMQHAGLYESERHARQVAESLRSANVALTRSLELNSVLNTLLDNLATLIPYDSASIMLLQDEYTVTARAIRGYERWTDPARVRDRAFDLDSTATMATVFKSRQPLLISDTHSYAAWLPTPGSEHIRSWLGIPLLAGGRVIGLCSLDKTQPGFFVPEHVRLAEALVAQAAIAIQNAQLFEQVRVGRAQQQQLSRRLVEVQETERRRIARELHDDAGQALAALMVGLRLIERDAAQPEAVLARAAELRNTTDRVLENLHRLAMDLRPASLDHLGLLPALEQYAETFGRQSGLAVQFEAFGLEGTRLSPDVETNLYRIVQESLANVVRHARASHVDVLLERRGQRVLLIVEDNGMGFDPEEAVRRGRSGLFGMRERAEMLGGHLTIESSPGSGTTLFVEVPYGD